MSLINRQRTLPRAVLFDLDDTLIDRSRTLLRFAERFARDFADGLADGEPTRLHPLIREADRNGYRTRDELVENFLTLLPWRSAPSRTALATYWAENAGRCSTPSPGALGLIGWLRTRGVKIGVVTNGPPTQHDKIDALGVRARLDTIVVSEEVGVAKPDAEIFRIALANLGVGPDQAWFVGDHPVNDVAGAHQAGLRPFWLRRGIAWPEGQAAIGSTIDSLEELLALLVEAPVNARRAGRPAVEPATGG